MQLPLEHFQLNTKGDHIVHQDSTRALTPAPRFYRPAPRFYKKKFAFSDPYDDFTKNCGISIANTLEIHTALLQLSHQ